MRSHLKVGIELISWTNPHQIFDFTEMVVTKTRGKTFSRKQLTHEKFIEGKMMLLAPDVEEQSFGPDWQQWRWIIKFNFCDIILNQYLFFVLKLNWWMIWWQVRSRTTTFFSQIFFLLPWFGCILAHLDGGWSLTSESRRLTFVMHGTQYKCLATSPAYSKSTKEQ